MAASGQRDDCMHQHHQAARQPDNDPPAGRHPLPRGPHRKKRSLQPLKEKILLDLLKSLRGKIEN